MFTSGTVTVVTAATGHRHLLRCLLSVQQQSYTRLEHLVVIDGPEHESRVRHELRRLGAPLKPLNVLLLPQPTGKDGWCGHRIYGAASFLVNTEYISFLDEDNWLEPNHVESLVSAVAATNAQWGFSLRNIVDSEGRFIARDECECLGNLHPVYYNKDRHHVDASCYLLKREVAVGFSSLWYSPTRAGGPEPEADTYLCKMLLEHCPQVASNRQHTVNYTVGNRADSVQGDFFLKGNEVMRSTYPQGLPWK